MPQRSRRNWINFFLGFLVVLLSFIGLPSAFKNVILAVSGLLIAFFSLATPGQSQSQGQTSESIYEEAAS